MFPARFTFGAVIAVPAPQVHALTAWRERFGGDAAACIAPHITLVSGSYIHSWEDAAAHARRVSASWRRFDISLGPAATFRPASNVVFLPLREGAEECWAMHRTLVGEHLRQESNFSYHPHLTIAQDLSDEELDAAQGELSDVEVHFTAQRVQLFATDGGCWKLCEEIELP